MKLPVKLQELLHQSEAVMAPISTLLAQGNAILDYGHRVLACGLPQPVICRTAKPLGLRRSGVKSRTLDPWFWFASSTSRMV